MWQYEINFLINLQDDIEEDRIELVTIKSQWSIYMEYQLKLWNFNKYSIDALISWGRGGHNWKLLHWDDKKDYKEYLKEFASEIGYCSDRMSSLDRILRCHWLLNAALTNAMNQNETPYEQRIDTL